MGGDGQPDTSSWQPGSPINLPAPDLNCPNGCGQPTGDLSTFLSDLGEYACDESGEIGEEKMRVYKCEDGDNDPDEFTLYTIPADDTTGATVGEIVNGEFKATSDGLLVVEIKGSNSIANLYGSDCPNDPGWHELTDTSVPPDGILDLAERQGSLINSYRCLKLQLGESFQFNVQAGKGDAEHSLSATFYWHSWDAANWCLNREVKRLTIKVRPMDYDLIPKPATVRRCRMSTLGGSNATAIRIPGCGSNRSPGNSTNWFIPWPTVDGDRITNGHAKGWKIRGGNSIKEPGDQGLEYTFPF